MPGVYTLIDKTPLIVHRLISLRNNIFIFFISHKIINLVQNLTILYLAIRSFNKAIFINTGINSQRANQTNVRAFRRFNRTHTAVMAVVYVAHLKTGTVTGKTTRPQSRKTAFMRQLGQRIVLIHKLGKL